MINDHDTAIFVTNVWGGNKDSYLVTSSVFNNSFMLRQREGVLLYFHGYNASSNTFIQFFDTQLLPTSGSTPIFTQLIIKNSNFDIPLPIGGIHFISGIFVGLSVQAESFIPYVDGKIYLTALVSP